MVNFAHMHMPDAILCFSTHCTQLLLCVTSFYSFFLPLPSRGTISTNPNIFFGQENIQEQSAYIKTSRKSRIQLVFSASKTFIRLCECVFVCSYEQTTSYVNEMKPLTYVRACNFTKLRRCTLFCFPFR